MFTLPGTDALPPVGDPALDLARKVAAAVLERVPEIDPGSVMLVGARCRDLLHAALGHTTSTKTTTDLDLALGLRDWEHYDRLIDGLTPLGHNDVRFELASMPVDLIAFGSVEDPVGTVTPPMRRDPLSVWAFEEVHATSLPLTVAPGITIRIPTAAGYCAIKLAAWLDRSADGNDKDAPDIGLVMHWYAESPAIEDRLYDPEKDLQVVLEEEMDVARGAARLLGRDIARIIGPQRRVELLDRWPGDRRMLLGALQPAGSPWRGEHREQLLDALTRGLAEADPSTGDQD